MTTDLRTAAQQALEALEKYQRMMLVEAGCQSEEGESAIDNLRAALAEPVQEPAALLTTWISETEAVTEPLFKAPRRLTDAEIGEVWFSARIPGLNETDARRLIRAAEARSCAR